jgi:putative RecB family exonuclease
MSFPLPTSLTPSKVASFKDCALAFRFSAIDKLPEPPSPPALKGTLVHKVLERLFWEQHSGSRTLAVAQQMLREEAAEFFTGEEWTSLQLSEDDARTFESEAEKLVCNYFELEDPNAVRTIGTELMMEATVGNMRLRGIIDRLDLDSDGNLVVVDYKTGRAPGATYENNKLGGVHFYAYLCEQVLGRTPAKVRLLYLREPLSISTDPSAQSIRGMQVRTTAIWSAVERACEREDFRPNPGKLCNWCSFQEFCPAKGGTLPESLTVPVTVS